MLALKLTQLIANVSEGLVSHRVAKVLQQGSEVLTIHLTDNGDQKEAVLDLRTTLPYREVKRRLQSARINGQRFRVMKCGNDKIRINGAGQSNPRKPSQREMSGNDDEKAELRNYARELATCFHLHVNASDGLLERVTDREEMSIVFQGFLADMSSAERTESECLRLEGHVMTQLRQQRLLRSKRVGERVVMTMARMGGPGDFPARESIQTERELFLERLAEAESNKEGVEIRVASFEDDIIGVKESKTLSFTMVSQDPFVELQQIHIGGGPRAIKAFSVVAMEHLPCFMGIAERAVDIAFKPHHVGVYHCSLRCKFQTRERKAFMIVRYIKLRCGDATLDALLKPVAPYMPVRKSYFDSDKPTVSKVFHPPAQPDHERDKKNNPFLHLPHYKIPRDTKQLICMGDLAMTLKKPETGLETYISFWGSLLYASEFQAQQDIKLFDMENTRLTKEGKFFVVTVPGLAEGRPSVLRGDIVHISWNNTLYRARVHTVRLLDVLLDLHGAFHRSFNAAFDLVDLRFTFSRTIFRTSHNGIMKAPETMGMALLLPDVNHVKENLVAKRCRELPLSINFANRDLNSEQQTAIWAIIQGAIRPLPHIIWGPPGTGKSTTVVEAVYQLARHASKPKILVVAPSNDAVDILVAKLSSYFPPSNMRRLLAYSHSIGQLLPVVVPYARDSLSSDELCQEALSAQIIVSTVNLAARLAVLGVARGHFNVLCVDEAGHATEPEVVAVASTLMDFQRKDDRVGQLILAGDPKQLGPIVTSDLCRKFGLDVSYMERIANRQVYTKDSSNQLSTLLITKLVRNYRSHPSILKLPNELFYGAELVAAGNPLKTHDMTRWEYLPNKKFPILFHATRGENVREGNSPSWFNPQEAEEVVNYVDALVYQSRPAVAQQDIGVITPYNRQAQKIRLALASRNLKDIKVGSVETFQGQERRCIIVSTVRTDTGLIQSDLKYNLGFIANSKRFNVAMTRACSLLIVIGDPNVLAADKKNWLPLLLYCKENNSWAGEPWNDTGDRVLDWEGFEDVASGGDEMLGPSMKVAQEGIGFINREE